VRSAGHPPPARFAASSLAGPDAYPVNIDRGDELRSEDVRNCSDPTDPNSTALFARQGQTTLVNAPDIRLALDTEHRVAPI
jgi:hypothetical protein